MKTTSASMATINDIPLPEQLIQPFDPFALDPCSESSLYREGLSWGFLRLDLIHPAVSGNKWFKLKHNLRYAIDKGCKSVLTFGGAYSNHLHATAAAAREYGLKAIGLVRGMSASVNLTPTLATCKELGMDIVFIAREEYSRKDDIEYLRQLKERYPDSFIIPEGGANEQGRAGAEEIAAFIPSSYSHVCVSVGTGTTFVGLRNGLHHSQSLLGFVPLRGGSYLKSHIRNHLYHDKDNHWILFDDYHFGGFGRSTDQLIDFMNSFFSQTSIPLDVVYTSKMMFGIGELLRSSFFPSGSRILCVHTGGLQGNVSVKDKLAF